MKTRVLLASVAFLHFGVLIGAGYLIGFNPLVNPVGIALVVVALFSQREHATVTRYWYSLLLIHVGLAIAFARRDIDRTLQYLLFVLGT